MLLEIDRTLFKYLNLTVQAFLDDNPVLSEEFISYSEYIDDP